jgi:hypothetical protein
MIVTKLTGGLGNQFFQYAAGLSVAIANNTTLKLDISSYQISSHRYRLDNFNITAEVLPVKTHSELSLHIRRSLVGRIVRRLGRELESKLNIGKMQLYKDPGRFDPNVLSLPDGTCLEGYWQSEKYFAHIADIVRREFTPKPQPSPANKDMAEQIVDCESVSLHIRRGDYVSNPEYNRVHGTCDISYYKTAVTMLAKEVKNPCFFVFSDDIDWARRNLQLDFPTTFVDINGPDSDFEDLRLMTYCKHHIIANSTFSWWGAWLCDYPSKIVFAPNKWFRAADKDASDIVPEGWRRI